MRKTEIFKSSAGEYTVREMTIGEIRLWLNGRLEEESNRKEDNAGIDVIGEFILEDLSLFDLSYMCDLPVSDFDQLPQSEANELEALCKKLNPGFFGLRSRMKLAGTRES